MGHVAMKNSKNKVLKVLIPDGESWLAYSVQSCLAQIPDIKVVVLSNNAWDSMRFSRYTHQFFSYVQGEDDKAKLEAVYDTVKRAQIDIVLPVDNDSIRLLSLHKKSLLEITALAPVPDVELIDIAANKWLLAEWLQQHDIPCPTTILYRLDQDFEKELDALTFPVLLKPTQQLGDSVGVGGRGICIFNNRSELLAFRKENTVGQYIIQSFINGYDLGCNVLCREGKIEAYTIQKGFMASNVRFEPAVGIDFIDNTEAYNVVSDLVSKLNWTGVANFDLRYDEQDQQIKVIEINPRFWGSLLGSFCAGVNFPYLACLAGLDQDCTKINYKSIRYVNGGAAINLLRQRFIQQRYRESIFDSSALEFMLKDPFPKIFAYGFRVWTKMLSILGSKV